MSLIIKKSPSDAPLLTTEQVERWRAEYAETEGKIKALHESLERQAKRLAAVATLIGEKAESEELFKKAYDSLPEPEPTITWREAILGVLVEAGKGLEPHEITRALKKTDFKDRVTGNPNGLYNTITRMAAKGDLLRKGKLVYASDVLDRMIKNGADISTVGKTAYEVQPDSTASLIVKVLNENPQGLRGARILEKLKQEENAPKSVFNHSSFLYTILGKLVARNVIVKRGKVFKTRPQMN